MDPCASTDACIDKVVGRFGGYETATSAALAAAVAQIRHLKQELLLDPDTGPEVSVTGVMLFENALEKLKDALRRLSAEHKEIHASISKTGKEIDKNFTSDFSGVVRGNLGLETNSEQKERVNKLIAQHFLTQGHLDLAELLSKESGVDLDESNKAGFVEMNDIISSLERHELGPAIAWAQTHAHRLKEMDSRLEFRLHRLRFVQLLQEGKPAMPTIIDYMRQFGAFVPPHEKEVCELMGAVMFAGPRLASSPYAQLLDTRLWLEVTDTFRQDSCTLLALPAHSPLSQILNSGTVALPALLNLRSVMESRKVLSVWGSDELPMDIELGPDAHYHSVFACPILRQQTTASNPPMRLTCGHAISKDALHKLSTSNRSRLKCPYCPLESLVADAKRVYF